MNSIIDFFGFATTVFLGVVMVAIVACHLPDLFDHNDDRSDAGGSS